MRLSIPPLRQRKEDISGCAAKFIGDCSKTNERFLKLTQGGMEFLQNYSWPGNLDQLKSVCESLVFLSPHRSVNEVFIQEQLQTPWQETRDNDSQYFENPKAAELIRLLKENNGDRELTAAKLGINRSTLWRRMKKYGINSDFTL